VERLKGGIAVLERRSTVNNVVKKGRREEGKGHGSLSPSSAAEVKQHLTDRTRGGKIADGLRKVEAH
jgi:hypothetical protein